jgi:hypothetical protein
MSKDDFFAVARDMGTKNATEVDQHAKALHFWTRRESTIEEGDPKAAADVRKQGLFDRLHLDRLHFPGFHNERDAPKDGAPGAAHHAGYLDYLRRTAAGLAHPLEHAWHAAMRRNTAPEAQMAAAEVLATSPRPSPHASRALVGLARQGQQWIWRCAPRRRGAAKPRAASLLRPQCGR